MTDNDNELIDLEVIPDMSVAKQIQDLEGMFSSILSSDDVKRRSRFFSRMAQAGRHVSESYRFRSKLAEELYCIKKEEDWKIIIRDQVVDEETGEISVNFYEKWVDFRDLLATVLPISTGSIGSYVKMVTIYVEGLGKDVDTFADTGGIVSVKHIRDMSAGHDMRTIEDGMLKAHLRPKTEKFAKELDELYPGNSYPNQLSAYYDEHVAHDYNDPAAINKGPSELDAQGKEMLGAPAIWATSADNVGHRYKIHVKYPDMEVDGSTVIGDQDSYTLMFDEPSVPNSAVEWLMSKLRI